MQKHLKISHRKYGNKYTEKIVASLHDCCKYFWLVPTRLVGQDDKVLTPCTILQLKGNSSFPLPLYSVASNCQSTLKHCGGKEENFHC